MKTLAETHKMSRILKQKVNLSKYSSIKIFVSIYNNRDFHEV